MVNLKSFVSLLALATASLLALAVGAASAGRLSSSSQTWRATFSLLSIESAFGQTACPVTLEGSLHSRTTGKTTNALVGYVTRAALERCLFGAATILTETLPWHLQYISFGGSLPIIREIRYSIVNMSLRVREPSGITCLARSTAAEPVSLWFTRETSTGVLTGSTLQGIVGTGSECLGLSGSVSAIGGTATVAGAATRITVFLI
jgi:hypothetical protein